MNCDCSANTNSDETRPSVASGRKAPPTESRHIGKIVETRAVVKAEQAVALSGRSSTMIRPAGVETTDDSTSVGDSPAADWRIVLAMPSAVGRTEEDADVVAGTSADLCGWAVIDATDSWGLSDDSIRRLIDRDDPAAGVGLQCSACRSGSEGSAGADEENTR